MKTTVIHHSADFDGIFCREIARRFVGQDAELIGWDYGDAKIPFPTDGKVFVLDLSPECFASMPDINEVGRRLIWIDHHKSAIEKWPEALPGYRIDGVAACRLVWQYFSSRSRDPLTFALPDKEAFVERNVSEPLAVRLAGEYDIWDRRDPDAETFQFGLRSQDMIPYHWGELLDNTVPEPLRGTGMEETKSEGMTRALLSNGRVLQRYQREMDASLMTRTFNTEFEGYYFLALNTARCNSLTFAAGVKSEHDALMGFYWTGKEWSVSLYHAPGKEHHDLSTIAVKYGGGGHRGACGFRAGTLPFLP